MIHSPSPKLTQRQCRFDAVRSGLAFGVSLLLAQLQAMPSASHAQVVTFAQDDLSVRSLEPGTPFERELAGGQSHIYRLKLAADEYVKLEVDQRGVDVTIKFLGPDGKQLLQVDAEVRTRGKETVEEVAETAGDYRLVIQSKVKNADVGDYEVRIAELRVASEND